MCTFNNLCCLFGNTTPHFESILKMFNLHKFSISRKTDLSFKNSVYKKRKIYYDKLGGTWCTKVF